jgi:hypothetical protein
MLTMWRGVCTLPAPASALRLRKLVRNTVAGHGREMDFEGENVRWKAWSVRQGQTHISWYHSLSR